MTDAPPLRILHLTAGSDAGGLSRYIADLCEAMHAQGHQVTVAGQRGASHDLFEHAPYPWIDAPLKGGPLALRRAVGILRDHLQSRPVDIIHCHYRRPVLVARRLQKIFNVPILFTLHQPRINISGLWRWLTDFGDHCHVASDDGRQWLIEEAKYPAKQISTIPLGIDPEKFPRRDQPAKAAARRELALPADARVAAFVGRFDDVKNPLWMVDVAIAAQKALPDLHIIMFGAGPSEPELRRQIARANVTDRIHLPGYRDPLPAYQAADALLVPSQREGFSYVCAEAMSVGIPVLRTQTGGAKEMIIENQTGRSTPIDRAAFTAAAMDFLQDTAALDRMGAAAADHVRANFTFDRQLRETIALYWRLAHRAESGRA